MDSPCFKIYVVFKSNSVDGISAKVLASTCIILEHLINHKRHNEPIFKIFSQYTHSCVTNKMIKRFVCLKQIACEWLRIHIFSHIFIFVKYEVKIFDKLFPPFVLIVVVGASFIPFSKMTFFVNHVSFIPFLMDFQDLVLIDLRLLVEVITNQVRDSVRNIFYIRPGIGGQCLLIASNNSWHITPSKHVHRHKSCQPVLKYVYKLWATSPGTRVK